MILDMNPGLDQQVGEVCAYPDWPYTPPARANVREQVILKGSTTGGVVNVGRGTADQAEPPRPYPGIQG